MWNIYTNVYINELSIKCIVNIKIVYIPKQGMPTKSCKENVSKHLTYINIT